MASLGRDLIGDRILLGGIGWNSKSLTSATLTGRSSSKISASTDGSFFKITTGLELRKTNEKREYQQWKINRCTYSLVDDLIAGLPPSLFSWRSMNVSGPFAAPIDRLESELGRTTSLYWPIFDRSSVVGANRNASWDQLLREHKWRTHCLPC